MPFTFLAHQVPVIPIKRRWEGFDGLALVAGSVAPDLFYVTQGWGWGPLGIPLWQDGHDWKNAITHWGLTSLVLCVVARRWVLPVLPRALPDGGDFHWRDYAVLAGRRPAWWITVVSGMVGGATHVFIDGFTHADGFAVEAAPALAARIVSIGGHSITAFKVLQFAGHIGGSALAIAMLRRIGRERDLLRWAGVEPAVVPGALRADGRWAVLAGATAGVGLGTWYAVRRSDLVVVAGVALRPGISVPIMAFCWVFAICLFAGCVVASLAEASVRRIAASR